MSGIAMRSAATAGPKKVDSELPVPIEGRNGLDVEARQAHVDQREPPGSKDKRPLASNQMKHHKMEPLAERKDRKEESHRHSESDDPGNGSGSLPVLSLRRR
jgi:hypothetical protein